MLLFLLSFPSASLAQPTPDLTLSSFTQLQRHIRSWTPAPDDEPFTPVIGACLTLKLRGEVIAHATAWSEHPFDDKPESPTVLRRVLAEAIKLAEPKLGIPNDALRDEAIKQTAQDITLSLELAGPLIAIEPTTWEDAELTLRPGLDGVAAQRASRVSERSGAPAERGGRDLASIFPAQMLLTSSLPHRALGSVIAQSLGEGGAAAALEEPRKTREKNGLRFYRFRTSHAAQSTAKGSPSLLYRGEGLLPSGQPMTIAELRTFAGRLADHLVARLLPETADGERRMLASIRPGTEIDSTPAPALDQLVAAYAVEQYRGLIGEDGTRADKFGDPRYLFVRAADHAGKSRSPAAPAMYLLVGDAIIDPHKSRSLIQARARTALRFTMFDEGSISTTDVDAQALVAALHPRALPVPLRPILVMAALNMPHDAESSDHTKTDPILRSIYSETPEGRLPSLMPWLGWAELAQARRVAEARAFTGLPTEIPASLALRRMRDQVWQHQLTPLTATQDTQDMIGGIVFTSGLEEGKGNPYPTWQCVRPLAFIATMLGDTRLTSPEERPREIANLMLAMRYLRQLQVDDASAWMYPNPEQAKGGIRAAVWDNTEPADATSLTLLCVTELLKSLDKLAAENHQPPPAQPTK